MDFRFTEEQTFFRSTVANAVKKVILPHVQRIDEKDEFPHDVWNEFAKLGYFGLRYPEKYGGMNADKVTSMIFYEEMAKGSAGFAVSCIMQCLMGTYFIYRFGNESIRQKILVPAIKGEKISTMCFTEDQSGSDLAGTKTNVVKDGNYWLINGRKMWITQAPICDFATVLATTDPKLGLKGLNFFLVEKNIPGVSHGQIIHKLGVRGSVTGELVMDNVRLPKEYLLGKELGKGVVYLGEILNEVRCMTAAMALGIAQAAFQEGLEYARKRVALGKPIGKYQLIRAKFAKMAAEMEATKWLVYSTAWKMDQGENPTREAAMAKYYATEMCLNVVDQVTRIFGANGFAYEYNPQRYLRDARFLLYGGGTQEIISDFIGRQIIGKL
ncbi:acyl-CoA dehydrogenase family protein [Planctomycetota bacterium]